jgi:hypothetical protein
MTAGDIKLGGALIVASEQSSETSLIDISLNTSAAYAYAR